MRQLRITKSITNRDSESLEKYLQEISTIPLLRPDEEAELAAKIKTGDQRALDALVKANLRFVVSVAKKYQNQGLSLSDLINEGNLGAIKAAQRFDETTGFKFISYAVWRIRQSILQALAEQSRLVRLPVNKVSLKNETEKTRSLLEQLLERDPSAEELAEELGRSEREVELVLLSQDRHKSFDAAFGDDNENTLLDVFPDPHGGKDDEVRSLRDKDNKDVVDKLLGLANSDRDREIISLCFGLNKEIGVMRPKEIGERYGIQPEAVRQIREKWLKKVRKNKFALQFMQGNLSALPAKKTEPVDEKKQEEIKKARQENINEFQNNIMETLSNHKRGRNEPYDGGVYTKPLPPKDPSFKESASIVSYLSTRTDTDFFTEESIIGEAKSTPYHLGTAKEKEEFIWRLALNPKYHESALHFFVTHNPIIAEKLQNNDIYRKEKEIMTHIQIFLLHRYNIYIPFIDSQSANIELSAPRKEPQNPIEA